MIVAGLKAGRGLLTYNLVVLFDSIASGAAWLGIFLWSTLISLLPWEAVTGLKLTAEEFSYTALFICLYYACKYKNCIRNRA